MAANDRTAVTVLGITFSLGLALMLPAFFDDFVLTQVVAILGGILVVFSLLAFAYVLARKSERRF